MKTLNKINTVKTGKVTTNIIVQLAEIINEIIDNQNKIIEEIRNLKNTK